MKISSWSQSWNSSLLIVLSAGLSAAAGITVHGLAAGQAGVHEHVQVTFTKDIAPILQRSCENCHRKGGVAPMSLSTYSEARPWARAIKLQTSLRQMPPWFMDTSIGIQKFKDDISLSDDEIAKIGVWVDSGAPQGNPADMPPPRQYADARGWRVGEPDVIVSSPVMTVKAYGADWYGEVGPVSTGLTEDRYIQAVETKEVRLDARGLLDEDGFKRVQGKTGDLNLFSIHHAAVSEIDPATGHDFAEVPNAFSQGLYVAHDLGINAAIYPKDAGNLLKAGSAFVYAMHLHSIGREVQVRLDVALKFHPKGWKPKYRQSGFLVLGGSKDDLDIPAGQDNVSFENFYRMPQHALMITFEPHMHSSGKRMCVEAIYPDMRCEVLNCAGYNHNWAKVYAYEDDVAPLLPAGTLIHYIGWYDNTVKNPRVVDPRNWKGWGNRSIDDMFFFRTRVIFLTDEQYKGKVAERETKTTR